MDRKSIQIKNKVGRAIRVSADIQQNFLYGRNVTGFTKIWALILEKIAAVQMKQLLKKLTGNIDNSINFSTIFSYLSKPTGAAFFSIAYIQHTSEL